MRFKTWVAFFTLLGSVLIFAAWLMENSVKKELEEKLNIINSYTQRLNDRHIDDAIMETRLWNVRNIYKQDTTNQESKEIFIYTMSEYQKGFAKSTEIAYEGYNKIVPEVMKQVMPEDSTEKFISDLGNNFKDMMEDSTINLNDVFSKLVLKDFYPHTFDSEIFKISMNPNDYLDENIKLANKLFLLFYILGSLSLAAAFLINYNNQP